MKNVTTYDPSQLEDILKIGRKMHDEEIARRLRVFFGKLFTAKIKNDVAYRSSAAKA